MEQLGGQSNSEAAVQAEEHVTQREQIPEATPSERGEGNERLFCALCGQLAPNTLETYTVAIWLCEECEGDPVEVDAQTLHDDSKGNDILDDYNVLHYLELREYPSDVEDNENEEFEKGQAITHQ